MQGVRHFAVRPLFSPTQIWNSVLLCRGVYVLTTHILHAILCRVDFYIVPSHFLYYFYVLMLDFCRDALNSGHPISLYLLHLFYV